MADTFLIVLEVSVADPDDFRDHLLADDLEPLSTLLTAEVTANLDDIGVAVVSATARRI